VGFSLILAENPFISGKQTGALVIQVITCDVNVDSPLDTCPTKYQMPCSKHWKRTERIAIAKQAGWLNCNCFPKAVVRLVQHLMMTPHAQPQKWLQVNKHLVRPSTNQSSGTAKAEEAELLVVGGNGWHLGIGECLPFPYPWSFNFCNSLLNLTLSSNHLQIIFRLAL